MSLSQSKIDVNKLFSSTKFLNCVIISMKVFWDDMFSFANIICNSDNISVTPKTL